MDLRKLPPRERRALVDRVLEVLAKSGAFYVERWESGALAEPYARYGENDMPYIHAHLASTSPHVNGLAVIIRADSVQHVAASILAEDEYKKLKGED